MEPILIGLAIIIVPVITIIICALIGLKILEKTAQRGQKNKGTEGEGRKTFTNCGRGEVKIIMQSDTPKRCIINTPGYTCVNNSANNWEVVTNDVSTLSDCKARGYEDHLGSPFDWFGYFLVGFLPSETVRAFEIDAAHWENTTVVGSSSISHEKRTVSYLDIFPERRFIAIDQESKEPEFKFNVKLEIRLTLKNPLVAVFDRKGKFYDFVDSAITAAVRKVIGDLTHDEIKNHGALAINLCSAVFRNNPELIRLMEQSGYEIREVVFLDWDYSEQTQVYLKSMLSVKIAEQDKLKKIIDAQAQAEIEKIVGAGEATALEQVMTVASKYNIDPNIAAAGYFQKQALQELKDSGLLVYGNTSSGVMIPAGQQKQRNKRN